VEAHEGRARELEENVRLLGAANVQVVHADGRDLPVSLTGFDRALVDAPCSGLGVLAARPDLRWRAEPLPELQLELVRAAAARLRPGGTLVYAVCTIDAEESEEVVVASGLEVDAADFMRLGAQIEALLSAGCRIFHFDVGDAHFVPPVTIGPVVLRSIAPAIHAAGGMLDCHLMVDDPAHHFEEVADSGGDSVT